MPIDSARTLLHRSGMIQFVAVFCTILCFGNVSSGEELVSDPTPEEDPYDGLYDVIMTRHGNQGQTYGADEASPAIFVLSSFPFGDRTFQQLDAALDAFAELPQSTVEAYSDVKRAMMQRHLWKVFDATFPTPGTRTHQSHADRRESVRPKLVSIMQRLALPKNRIMALPDTLAATVNSGEFTDVHDPEDLQRPFLPTDFFSQRSAWVCLGELDNAVPADIHTEKFRWRSAFVSFVRGPGERDETLRCIHDFQRTGAFPFGTQFALVEQAFFISDRGKIVLSPLVASIQMRGFVNVEKNRLGKLRPVQSIAEFTISPRRLAKGDAKMKPMSSNDYRFESGDALCLTGGIEDPFESGSLPPLRLNLCRKCHANMASSAAMRSGLRTAGSGDLTIGDFQAIIDATRERKREDETWKTFRSLWQSSSET